MYSYCMQYNYTIYYIDLLSSLRLLVRIGSGLLVEPKNYLLHILISFFKKLHMYFDEFVFFFFKIT